MALAGFITGLFLVVVLLEVSVRRWQLHPEVIRKVGHAGAAVVAFLAPLYLLAWVIVFSGVLVGVVLLVTKAHALFPSVRETGRRTAGEPLLFFGVALAAALLLPAHLLAYQFGVLMLGFADVAAALVGRFWGQWTIMFFGHRKSLEGSAAFFAVSCVAAYVLTGAFVLPILFIAAVLTVVEFGGIYGVDNLLLPAAGGMLFLLVL